MTPELKEKYLELMNDFAAANIPVVMIAQEATEIHYARNCEHNVTAQILSNFIDSNQEVQEAFVEVLSAKESSENTTHKPSFQERIDEKMEGIECKLNETNTLSVD